MGRAVFSLAGKGKVAPLRLPASAVFRADIGKKHPRTAIIVQAEILPDGSKKYGVLVRGGIVEMSGKDLVQIQPLMGQNTQESEAD
jgi:hypothetical protein